MFSLACLEIRSRNKRAIKRAINSTQNMRGLDHATIPIPSSHGLRKERLAQWSPLLCPKCEEKRVADWVSLLAQARLIKAI